MPGFLHRESFTQKVSATHGRRGGRMRIAQRGSAAAQCGNGFAYRWASLRLLEAASSIPEAEPQERIRTRLRKGGAIPHCAAAEPKRHYSHSSVARTD